VPTVPASAAWRERVLRKYGYPPDKTEQATLTVIEQAEAIAKDWAG
jgi:type I restriction enzyme R subunit